MELKTFVNEIVKDWLDYLKLKKIKKVEALNGALSFEVGNSGEKYILDKLKKNFPKYEFVLTNGSKSPADIIGLHKTSKHWHFALYQVKTSLDKKMLKSEIDEKYTLPILAEIIKLKIEKSTEKSQGLNKQIIITTGYVGVHKQKNHSMYKSIPYPKTFSLNKLSLTTTEKTELKNNLHRNIK